MIKKLFIFSILMSVFLIYTISFAKTYDDKEIFFLTGTPAPQGDTNFPSNIYKLDTNKLSIIMVRELVNNKIGTEFINSYFDKRLIALGNKFNANYETKMLQMDTPLKEILVSTTLCKGCSYIHAYIFDIPNRGLFNGVILSSNGNEKVSGKSFSTNIQEELSWEIFKNILASGISGINLAGGDSFYVSSDLEGQIVIPLGDNRIKTEFYLPTSMLLAKDDTGVAYINNREMLAFTSRLNRVEKDPIGSTVFYIYNKKNKKWNSITIQGCKSKIRSFGPWVAAYVADVFRGINSPGYEKRRQVLTETGIPIDWDLKYYKIYSTGKLFLYNLYTGTQYYLITNQGDNEVLLVEDDTVYFRANDEIYRAPIGDKEIGKPTLIVKDDVVPDIHWAFTTPYYPLEKGAFDSTDNGSVFYCMGRDFYKWSGYERKEFQENLTNIFRYDFTKKETRKLFPAECYLQRLSVADKTHYVAGLCTDPGAKYNLLVLDKDGNKVQEVSDQIQEYVWHPDGDKILYMTGTVINYGDRKEITPTGIWLYDVTSGSKNKIAEKGSNLYRSGFDKHIYFSDSTKTLRYNIVKKIVEPADTQNAIDYAPDGKAYVTGFDMLLNKMVAPLQIYDSTTNKSITPPHLSELHPANYEWGKDSGIIVFNGCKAQDCHDRQIYFYDLKKDKVAKQIKGDLVGVTSDRTGFIVYRDGELIIEKQ